MQDPSGRAHRAVVCGVGLADPRLRRTRTHEGTPATVLRYRPSRIPGGSDARPVTLVTVLVMASVTVFALGLAACSGGSTRTASPSATSTGGTVRPGTATSPGTPYPSVSIKVTPPLRPTCSMLDRATAARLLGAMTTARTADIRQPAAGTAQLDGCSYLAADARSLEYLVWSTTGSGPTAASPLPLPANAPVVRFNPRVGRSSSGVMITAGGRTSVTVTATRTGRLVQVTVAGPDASRAKQTASGAASTLLSAR
jgi:hypothetical protein